MRRALLAMSLTLVGLASLDHWIRGEQADARNLHGTLRPLVPASAQLVPERVHRLELHLDGGRFAYVREGDHWRFPAYHNAFAHSDRIEHLLNQSLQTLGTLSRIAPQNEPIGRSDQLAMQIDLYDRGDEVLTKLQFSGPVVASGGAHSLARVVGSDSVLTFHTDPFRTVGRGQPPLLDPHLLPRALPVGPLVDIELISPDRTWHLRRVMAPVTGGVPFPVDESQRYRWLLEQDGRVDTCHTPSVAAYVNYLRRLRIDGLTSDRPVQSNTRLRLTDEEGILDELTLAEESSEDGSMAIHNHRARIVGVVAAARATWLTPSASTLIDSLPQPSPFDEASPSTSGATP